MSNSIPDVQVRLLHLLLSTFTLVVSFGVSLSLLKALWRTSSQVPTLPYLFPLVILGLTLLVYYPQSLLITTIHNINTKTDKGSLPPYYRPTPYPLRVLAFLLYLAPCLVFLVYLFHTLSPVLPGIFLLVPSYAAVFYTLGVVFKYFFILYPSK